MSVRQITLEIVGKWKLKVHFVSTIAQRGYTQYLDDGDSKAYKAVLESKPYKGYVAMDDEALKNQFIEFVLETNNAFHDDFTSVLFSTTSGSSLTVRSMAPFLYSKGT
ncbi:hypothetical protein TNCV_1279041 [Trichonephila clavipes]|nr:hypothetical protein TNCV_1279041 [Trichonephila clavipes]